MGTPGDDPTALHDRVLGLSGDILPHQYPTVEVTNSVFHLIGNAIRVPTASAMTALLLTWNEAQSSLGPYTELDPETEVVRTRHMQLVPGRYASLLIHRRRIRPKHAYQELVGAIQAQNEADACADVITWLHAACSTRGRAGVQMAVPSVLYSYPPLHLLPEAYQYVTAKVRADLPALAPERDDAGDPVAAALLRLLGLARDASNRAEKGAAKAPKTIVESYKQRSNTGGSGSGLVAFG